MRDFIEIVFVKKRFYSADAPVPSSLGRLPVRLHPLLFLYPFADRPAPRC